MWRVGPSPVTIDTFQEYPHLDVPDLDSVLSLTDIAAGALTVVQPSKPRRLSIQIVTSSSAVPSRFTLHLEGKDTSERSVIEDVPLTLTGSSFTVCTNNAWTDLSLVEIRDLVGGSPGDQISLGGNIGIGLQGPKNHHPLLWAVTQLLVNGVVAPLPSFDSIYGTVDLPGGTDSYKTYYSYTTGPQAS